MDRALCPPFTPSPVAFPDPRFSEEPGAETHSQEQEPPAPPPADPVRRGSLSETGRVGPHHVCHQRPPGGPPNPLGPM